MKQCGALAERAKGAGPVLWQEGLARKRRLCVPLRARASVLWSAP